MTDELVLAILRAADAGVRRFHPAEHGIEALRLFQLVVDAARSAQAQRLIVADFQVPARGKTCGGLVRSFVVSALTSEGVRRLELAGPAQPREDVAPVRANHLA
jgi:hypothetical protein